MIEKLSWFVIIALLIYAYIMICLSALDLYEIKNSDIVFLIATFIVALKGTEVKKKNGR